MKNSIYKSAITLTIGVLLTSCAGADSGEDEKVLIHKIPVTTLNAQPETFNHFFEVKANIEAIEFAIISPESPGQIKKIYVNEGQHVNKGDVLIKQSSAVIDGQIQNVKTQLDFAEITYNKQKELWLDKKVGSEMQYLQAKTQYESLQEQLKTLQAQQNMATIKAPFSGIVDKINLKEGELASPGMQVIYLVNLNTVKFIGDVSEAYLPVINKGDSVDLSFSTYRDLKFREAVYRTGNIINPANRTFEVEIRAKNIENKLKPNMISTVRINDYSKDSAIIVPSIIVKKDFDKQFVFIAEKNDSTIVARKVFVKTGRSYKDKTIITEGIKPNTDIIIKGYNIVSNGSEISINN